MIKIISKKEYEKLKEIEQIAKDFKREKNHPLPCGFMINLYINRLFSLLGD